MKHWTSSRFDELDAFWKDKMQFFFFFRSASLRLLHRVKILMKHEKEIDELEEGGAKWIKKI